MGQFDLNEEDIRNLFHENEAEKAPQKDGVQIFSSQKPMQSGRAVSPQKIITPPIMMIDPTPSFGRLFINFMIVFILLFIVSFTIVNGPAIIIKFRYFWEVEYQNKPWGVSASVGDTTPQVTNNHLLIPKLKIDVPITWEVSSDDMITALENGIAHYQGTAIPGSVGNVFLSGHSSNYLWAKGDYKDVFALIDKLGIGDEVYVSNENKVYTYKVIDQKVVSPQDLSVLSQGNQKILSLMTCTPIGTNLKRLVITAELVSK